MYARSLPERGEGGAVAEGVKDLAPAGVFVRRIVLTNFRNYISSRVELPENAHRIVLTGANGAGKTNLLEAVSFLAPGKGIRNARFSDVTGKNAANNVVSFPWAVAAVIKNGDDEIEIGTGLGSIGAKNERRSILINGEERKSQADLGRVCCAVWLTPAMDRLFSGEPAGRRRFWDRLTQAFFVGHAGNCAAYARALKQWGKLLREGASDSNWLSALERTLGKYGAKIAFSRRETLKMLVEELEDGVTEFPRAVLSLTGGGEDFLSLLNEEDAALKIEEHFRQSRKSYAEGGLVGGVHTVELSAFHREKGQAAALCSTGEQKALLISVLLAHLKAQAKRTGTLPLLLLDEVTAHLDRKRRYALFEEIAALKTQVWMTGTEEKAFEGLEEAAHYIAVEELTKASPVSAAS